MATTEVQFEMDRSVDKSEPPKQTDVYNEVCCSYMKFHHTKSMMVHLQEASLSPFYSKA